MRARRRRQSSTCQACLVGVRCALGPALHHVGTVHGVAIEEVRDVPHDGEAFERLGRSRRGLVPGGSCVTDVDGQRCQPGLVEVPFDDFHERPDGAFGHPRVRLRVVARGPGERAGDQRPGKGEGDVGAHPVLPSGRDAQSGREALTEPALDALRRHGNDFGRHRILERFGHQFGEHRHQGVGAIGSVDVQHPGRVRRRCSRATGSAKPPAGRPCGATPCRCSPRPRAAQRWSTAPTRRRRDQAGRSAGGGAPSRSGRARRCRRTASPPRRGRGTCAR